jgi:NodT family efflux transporter outer membrane factor (OMF) lipoprotein
MREVSAAPVLPDSYSASGAVPAPERWWNSFSDPRLDDLVETALQGNLTIGQAWARLDQARALVRAAGAARWPGVDADATASRTRSGLESFNTTTRELSRTIDSLSLGATLSYQVDLWGKIDAQQQAEVLSFEASRRDLEATAQTIAGSIADTWFAVIEQRAALALFREQLAVNEEYLRLVELRFSQGLASAVEVFQQRLQVAATRNQIPQAETSLAVLENLLSVLSCRAPDHAQIPAGDDLPALPELPAMGVPADLVRNRPDVRAAELRLFAADRRVAIAVADRFPSLRFSSTAGVRSTGVSDLLDRWFVNLVGNLAGPIFDGGRRAAEEERTRAVLDERLGAWQLAVLTAVREVEDALVQEQGQRAVQEGVRQQIELTRQTLDRARSRYLNGLSDYLNVLTSLQNLQRLERTELQGRRQLLANRVRLLLALGGSWVERLERSGAAPANGE